MINIDRLHNHFGCKRGKGSGKTFDLLVESIHHEDFFNDCIFYIVTDDNNQDYIKEMFKSIAEDMGYKYFKVKPNTISLGLGNFFIFVLNTNIETIKGEEGTIVFFDHYVVPVGIYCYETIGFEFRNMMIGDHFCKDVQIMKIHKCLFYDDGDDEDPLLGLCKYLDCEVTDQCKECRMNSDEEYIEIDFSPYNSLFQSA